MKETGVGVPDLQLAVYSVDPGSASEFAAAAGEKLDTSRQRARGLRLGSILTDTWGRFTFHYECGQPGADLFVVACAPGPPAGSCGTTALQTVCIPQAGRSESCLMRIERDRLLDAGAMLPQGEAAAGTPAGLAERLAEAKKGLKPAARDKKQPLFSEKYKQRREEWKKLLAQNPPPAPTLGPQKVQAHVATAATSQFQVAEIVSQRDGRLAITLGGRPEPLLLRFAGADYRIPGQLPKGGVALEVDETAGTFRVVVPSSEGELRAPEFPSLLFHTWQAPRAAAVPAPQTPSHEPEE